MLYDILRAPRTAPQHRTSQPQMSIGLRLRHPGFGVSANWSGRMGLTWIRRLKNGSLKSCSLGGGRLLGD